MTMRVLDTPLCIPLERDNAKGLIDEDNLQIKGGAPGMCNVNQANGLASILLKYIQSAFLVASLLAYSCLTTNK